jgi:hypothetical protein
MRVGSSFEVKAVCDAISVSTEPFAELSRVDDAVSPGDRQQGFTQFGISPRWLASAVAPILRGMAFHE